MNAPDTATRVTLSINPVFIARVTGLPHATLQLPDSDNALAIWGQLAGLQTEMTKAAGQLTEELFHRIATSTGEAKIAYIQMRRDLHNARWSRIGRTASQGDTWPPALSRLPEQFEVQEKLRAKLETLLPVYVNQRLEQWRTIFCTSEVSKGIVLSAPEFWPRLNERPTSFLNENGLTKTAFTLLQYVSRCCTKTSPFSFFCPSAYGRIDEESPPIKSVSGELRLRSHALVNTAMVMPQLIASFKQRSDAEGRQAWAWNSSLQRFDGRYLWLTQRQNYDTVRQAREPRDPRMQTLLARLVTAFETGGTLPDARTLDSDIRGALLDSGLLAKVEFTQQELTEQIDAYLHPEREADASPEGNMAAEAKLYRENIMAFRHGNVSVRAEAWANLSAALEESTRKPTPQAATIKAPANGRNKFVIREDVMLTAELRATQSEFQPTLEALSAMQETFAPISMPTINRYHAATFYREHFDNAAEVPLLMFLQKLFERIKAWEDKLPKGKPIDLWAILRQNSPGPHDHRARTEALERTLIAQARTDLSRGTIDLLPAIQSNFIRPKISAPITGAYLQRAHVDGKDRWMVNNLGAGAGKNIRRWCVYNEDFAQRCKTWVKNMQTAEALDVIILDDVSFHADRGPRFFAHYFDLPGVHHIEPGLRPVSLQDCRIYVDAEGLLGMRTAHGIPIFAHYDSLLRMTVRPYTTQFLAMFGRPNSSFPLPMIVGIIHKAFVRAAPPITGPVVHHPRLELGDHTVLARRSWTVRREALPKLAAKVSPRAIVEAYTEWRQQHGVPARVFVRITHPPTDETERSGDIRKPQYLDFADPVWILFFHKYLSRYAGALFFEEALPNLPLPMGPLRDHFAELMVHWSYHTQAS